MDTPLDVEQSYGTIRELERAANALLGESVVEASEWDEETRTRVLPLSALDGVEQWLTGSETAHVMEQPPLDLPRHRVRSRFRWAMGEGGYAPPRYSRDGRRIYTVLGTPKMMRLVRLSEYGIDGGLVGPPQDVRRMVIRWMGLPAALQGVDKSHHKGAVKGKRRTASEIAAIVHNSAVHPEEGEAIDFERLTRLSQALAVGSDHWADRRG